MGKHEEEEQRRAEEHRKTRKQAYDAAQWGAALVENTVIKHHLPPGTFSYGASVAMGRLEEKVRADENLRIAAKREQDAREEEDAKQQAQQARRRLYGVLAGTGTLAAATAAVLSPSVQRMIRKALSA